MSVVSECILRADFFSSFKNIFEAKNKRALKIHSETTDISSVLLAISVASKNYLEGVDISFDIESDLRLSADILEIDFINLILNVLSFSVINAKDEVRVSLNKVDNFAEIEFAFASEFDFNLLGDNNLENSRLNSSLSLLIAITLSEIYSIPFRFEKRESIYRLILNLPVRASSELVFSKRDNLDEKIKRQLQAIFF